MVPSCTGRIRDYCSLLSSYRVDKTGLPSVRGTGDNDPNPVLQRLDAWAIEPLTQFRGKIAGFAGDGRVGGEIVLIIVDRTLGLGRKAEQARLPFVDPFP